MKPVVIQLLTFALLVFLQHSTSAQWIQTSGPDGGSVISISGGDTMMFACTYNKIYRSTNLGVTWDLLSEIPALVQMVSMVVQDNNLIVATYEGGMFRYSIYDSTWTQINQGLNSTRMFSLKVIGDYLFVGTNESMYCSTNNGDIWVERSIGLKKYNTVFSIVSIDSILFIGTANGVYRSLMNDSVWYQTDTVLQSDVVLSLVVCGKCIIAGTGKGAYVSFDYGSKWTESNNGLFGSPSMALVSCGSNIYLGTSNGVFKSSNFGSDWSSYNTGFSNNVTVNSFFVTGTHIYVALKGGGIYMLDNDSTKWKRACTGLICSEVSSLASFGSNLFAGTYSDGIFLSSNNGTNWTIVDKGLRPNIIRNTTVIDTNIFVGTMYNGIYMSSDLGINWVQINTGLSNSDVIGFAKIDSTLFVGTSYDGVYYSTNYGKRWRPVSDTFFFTDYSISAISALDSILFVGTVNGGVYISKDKGKNWIQPKNSPKNSWINSIQVMDNDVYVSTGNEIYRTTKYGNSWVNLTKGLSIFNVYALLVSGSNVFFSGVDGVFVSTNKGANWIRLSDDSLVHHRTSLATIGDTLFAGVSREGVWKHSITEFLTSVESRLVESTSSVCKISSYPNPVQQTSTIEFSIPIKSQVNVTIYNSVGIKILTLISEELEAGTHIQKWNSDDLPNGVYFVHVESGKFNDTMKLLVCH